MDEQDLAEHTVWWKQFLAPRTSGHQVFVVERCGRVIGFSMVGPLQPDYEFYGRVTPITGEHVPAVVYSIHVDPDHLGEGAGQELMTTSLVHLKSAGFGTVVLDTMEANDRARRFYDAAGWTAEFTTESEEYGPVVIYTLDLVRN